MGGYIKDYKLIRIQSTALEQKRWNFVLEDLSHEFLIDLAMGNYCILYDASSKRKETRAIWQGIPWIKFILERRWFGKAENPVVKHMNVWKYFDHLYKNLSDGAKKKIDYCGKFLDADKVQLEGRCIKSTLDGKYEELIQIMKEKT